MYLKQFQTRNKYKAKRTLYKGKKYDSKKEASYAMLYDSELRKGNLIKVEAHPRLELYGENGTRICYYKPDFRLTHSNGVVEIIDVKSKLTATYAFKLKWKLLEDKYKDEIKRGEIVLTVQY